MDYEEENDEEEVEEEKHNLVKIEVFLAASEIKPEVEKLMEQFVTELVKLGYDSNQLMAAIYKVVEVKEVLPTK